MAFEQIQSDITRLKAGFHLVRHRVYAMLVHDQVLIAKNAGHRSWTHHWVGPAATDSAMQEDCIKTLVSLGYRVGQAPGNEINITWDSTSGSRYAAIPR